MIRILRAAGQSAIAVTLLLGLLSAGALGQMPKHQMDFVAGDYMIVVRTGTPRADVDKIANNVNATVVSAYGSLDWQHSLDSYLLRARVKTTIVDTQNKVAQLKQQPQIVYAGYNHIKYMCDTIPNDPRYKEQWHLPLINLPAAWDIEKGAAGVVIGIVDSGTDETHPDLAARTLPGGQNFTGVGAANDLTDKIPHGTHVQGIAAAVTDNGVGVAGVSFQNVKCLMAKVFDTGGTTDDIIVNALKFLDGKVQVVNMSLGGVDASDEPDLTNPLNQQILAMAKKGILFAISAGNDGPNSPPINPANMASKHANIFCVAACGPEKRRSFYSSDRPYTTVAAPGGDDPSFSNNSRQILSTFPQTSGSYGFEQGTSMAAPVVAGTLALLISIPGVQPDEIKDTLQTTTNPAFALPNKDVGAGIIEVNQAVLKVSVSVTINSPDGFGGKASRTNTFSNPLPSETLLPTISIRVRQVQPQNLVLTIDGRTIDLTNPANAKYITNVTSTVPDPNGGPPIPTRYDIVIDDMEFSPGNHTIVVTGTNTNVSPPRSDSDTRTFTVTPHQIPAGRSFISIPYYDPTITTPSQYFGTGFSLARWVPWDYVGGVLNCTGRYAFFSSFGFNDSEASFTPSRMAPHPQNSPIPTYPLGLGFWADMDSVKPILTRGKPLTTDAFVIPLIPLPLPVDQLIAKGCSTISWNMIGDPFNFDVPFNTISVDTPTGRITINEAAARGLIIPNLYSYNGAGYDFRTLPDGFLHPWTGYWFGVTTDQPISLVIPPLSPGRAAPVPTKAAKLPGDGWVLRLSASSSNLRDTYNYIGTSSTATDGPDSFKVQKPPMMSPSVNVAITHDDWAGRSGVFAQDIRSSGGNKSWDVIVGSDQPNATVIFNWDQLKTVPRNVRLLLKDQSSGQTVDMRTRSSMSFNTGDTAAGRRFTITATQGVQAPVRISNLIVNTPSRAVGSNVIGFNLSGDATYTVNILSAAGRQIGTVATRAAAAGDVHLVWNGKDSSGKSVPAGTYIVQVRATGPDNDTVKAIIPFVVIR